MTFKGKLHPYQQEGFDAVMDRGRALLAYEVGLGKTPTSLAIVEALMEDGSVTEPGLVFTFSSLKYQWGQSIRKFTHSGHIVIDGTPAQRAKQYEKALNWWDEGIDYIVLNYESLIHDYDKISSLPRGFMVLDECFPAGTQVDTPTGPRNIEELQPGDTVCNALGTGTVRRVGSRNVSNLIRITISGGELVCTPNHKILTTTGWVEAGELTVGHEVVHSREAVRVVRGSVHPDHPSREVLREILLSEVENEAAGAPSEGVHPGDEGQAVGAKPSVRRNVDPGVPFSSREARSLEMDGGDLEEGGRGVAEDHRRGDPDPRRERHRADRRGAGATRRVGGGVEMEPRRQLGEEDPGVPHELQVGPSSPRAASRGRGGRAQPLAGVSEGAGPEEGAEAEISRVDRVEVLEQGDPDWDRLGGQGDRVRVFNLEVSGHPSYSVAGVLVHNCTAVKSHTSARHKLALELSKGVDVRIGLSGTPMTNGDPMEIFNQLAVIDPTVLGTNPHRFQNRYVIRNDMGWVTGYKNLPELYERLQPVMISKKQDDPDVAPYLPKTIYKEPILVPYDRAGKKLYNRIAEDLSTDLDEAVSLLGQGFSLQADFSEDVEDKRYGPEDKLRGAIASKVTSLRMLCSHPELLRVSAAAYDSKTGAGSKYLSSLAADGALEGVTKAPKLEALVRYLTDFLNADPKNKAVVFSTFVPTLGLIQNALKHESVTHSGAMNAKQKDAARVKFQNDPDTRVFISSDAGGYGLDLPQANLLINFDLPWSSGTANQRDGRVRRASSTFKHVVIQNFLMEGSLEERQWAQLQQKNRIESAVVEGRGINKGGGLDLDVASLRAFLRENRV